MAKKNGTTSVESEPSMSKASFVAVGKTPYMFGRPYVIQKKNEETGEQFEERSWIYRTNLDEENYLCCSGAAFQKSLCWAAGWLNKKIPGERGKTYKARFVAGLMVPSATFRFEGLGPLDPDNLAESFLQYGYKKSLFVDSKGQTGGKNSRVWRHYPMLNAGWRVNVEMLVLDNMITAEIFEKHATTAGFFDGIGSMRVGKGNPNGMYILEDFEFENVAI